MQQYDVMILGAGIAGCSCAYFLHQKGLKVLVLDRHGIAEEGGSAAAGAFVSPKIGKGSRLQSLTNEAFAFSKAFYLKNFPQYFQPTGVIRIPKDESDALLFEEYEKHNEAQREWISQENLTEIGIKESQKSFLFTEAGVCDAPNLCKAMLQEIEFVQYDVKSLNYENNVWQIGKYAANKLVLATGYETKFFDLRYMGVKGTWGTRGDYESGLSLDVSMHKKISISANIEGVIKVGATHEKEIDSCVNCSTKPLDDLFSKASTMVDTSDFKLKEIYCGMRAGSKDYFPLVGSVIDVQEMLKRYPKLVRGAKVYDELVKIENLYVCNGLGGRGFVFAPMMAKMLSELIVDGKEIKEEVNPDRLFLKWCRKSPDLER
jgi:tRNA 5-methylaminomethyl-2-thiouridine biosynthesis bifunctional protein